ncbi:MAG: carboxypeptidase regulatory-like domain-containing protein [Myxococcota bacterium]
MSPALFLLIPSALAGEVFGIVFDEDGVPVTNAAVQIGDQANIKTDPDGGFFVEIDDGQWPVTVRVPGRSPIRIDPINVVENETTEVLITLPPPGQDTATVLQETPSSSNAVVQDEDAATGTLNGTIVDEKGRPIQDARVFVRGQSVEGLSDKDGNFSLTVVSGTLGLSVLRSGYSTRSVEDVVVPPDGAQSVTIEMIEAGVMMDEFVVLIPKIEGGTAALLQERQNTSDLVDTLSAEEMSRRGDSSAASALKRVTGLTVVGGKFVFVRGLGERYSSTLFNGATLPSPEPERRVVPLDLFPTAMLDSVVVQKTFSPSLPAEFGGGTVKLRTRGVPDEPLLQVSLSGGYIHNTTFQDAFVSRDDNPGDFWGFGANFRALPQEIEDAAEAEPLQQQSALPGSRGYDRETLEELGEAMPNRWGLSTTQALPNLSASIVAGRGWDIGDNRIGVLGGLTFSNSWQLTQYTTKYYTTDGIDAVRILNEYDFEDTENAMRLGGIFEAAAEFGENHTIRATTVLTRDSAAENRQYVGINDDIGTQIQVQRTRWIERQLLVQQISGDHTIEALKGFNPRWRYSVSLARRFEPDRRDLIRERSESNDFDSPFQLRTQGGGNEIFFSDLSDVNHDVGIDLSQPFGDQEAEESVFAGTINAGGTIIRRTRQVDSRRFGYVLKGSTGDFLFEEPQNIFTPDTIDPTIFQFEEQTQPTDNYTATQEFEAAYAALDTKLPWRLQAIAGVRMEHSNQNVSTFRLFTATPEEINANLETTDYLPAITLTRRIDRQDNDRRMQIRGGYGRTLSRPDFRELSPAVFNDVIGGREVQGNAELERATIDNFDLRWEWYPTSDESVSFGGFYKLFDRPIEQVVEVGAVSRVTFENAISAYSRGLEIEFRKNLGFWPDAPDVLKEFYLSGNAAWIQSEITLEEGGFQTSLERPLQGQSPYVYNLTFTYEGIDSPYTLAVLYNIFGPRIIEVGAGGLPDTYEQPVHRLDATGSVRFAEAWRFKVNARNLLDYPSRLTLGIDQNETLVREIRTGWSLSVGLSWSPQLGE